MTDPEYETINWEFDDATGIGRITLDRPASMNAFDAQMQHELIRGIERFEELDSRERGVAVRTVVLTGTGDRAFSSGLDVAEMQDVEEYSEKKRIPDRFHEMAESIESFEPPIVAEVDGICLGGGLEVALACDFRFVSERSTFGQPEVDFGVLPGGGGAQRLSMIVGVSRAKELCMTGERIEAEQAESEGIVDYVYPSETLEREVQQFVETLSRKPPLALRSIKEAADRTREVGYQEALKYGSRAWLSLAQTDDYRKAVDAFGTDSHPEWEGR